jgi:FMN reductase
MEINHTIDLVAVQGSVRPNNNTARALNILVEYVADLDGASLEILDPTGMDLRLPGLGITDDARHLQRRIAEADGIILATPEYHGSYSSVMKLIIDNLGFPSALKGKPVALLGVASGRIGAIKALEHLRSVASHVGALVLPGPVSVANVRSLFDAEGRILDEQIAALIEEVPANLIEYIQHHICPYKTLEAMVRSV